MSLSVREAPDDGGGRLLATIWQLFHRFGDFEPVALQLTEKGGEWPRISAAICNSEKKLFDLFFFLFLFLFFFFFFDLFGRETRRRRRRRRRKKGKVNEMNEPMAAIGDRL